MGYPGYQLHGLIEYKICEIYIICNRLNIIFTEFHSPSMSNLLSGCVTFFRKAKKNHKVNLSVCRFELSGNDSDKIRF